MRQIFLDTETTGMFPDQGHRIIEIGCIEMINRRLSGQTRHWYLNPEREIDAKATEVHGITLDQLLDKPKFADIAKDFLEFVAGADLIIHNAPFDIGFLEAELALAKEQPLVPRLNGVIDTFEMARQLFPGKRKSLDALCERFGISHAHRTNHGALLDAGLLAEVYLAMTQGQDSLEIDVEAQPVTQSLLQAWPPPVVSIALSQADRESHEATLDLIEKENRLTTVWRTLQAKAATQG